MNSSDEMMQTAD